MPPILPSPRAIALADDARRSLQKLNVLALVSLAMVPLILLWACPPVVHLIGMSISLVLVPLTMLVPLPFALRAHRFSRELAREAAELSAVDRVWLMAGAPSLGLANVAAMELRQGKFDRTALTVATEAFVTWFAVQAVRPNPALMVPTAERLSELITDTNSSERA